MSLFVAIPLPEPVGDDLRGILPEGLLTETNSYPLHITLAYLGRAKPERATERIERVAMSHKPFKVKLQGSGSFIIDEAGGQVVFLGVEQTDEISNLARDLRTGSRDRYSFQPHVTVARKSAATAEVARSVQEAVESVRLPIWLASEIVLYQTLRSRGRSRYQVVDRFALLGQP